MRQILGFENNFKRCGNLDWGIRLIKNKTKRKETKQTNKNIHEDQIYK